jgi:hypothetical protein
MIGNLQEVGGGAVRPYASVIVENDCVARGGFPDCKHSDRLTLVTAIVGAPVCNILAITSSGTKIELDADCFEDDATFSFSNRQVMLVKGDKHRQVVIKNISSGGRKADMAKGQASLIDDPGVDADFVGGSVTPVLVATYYLVPYDGTPSTTRDPTNPTAALRVYVNTNQPNETTASPVIDPTETDVVATDVYDFQVQLGYDAAPSNGRVDDAGSTGDEWLFNAAGETGPGQAGTGLASASMRDLRMAAVGFIVGVDVKDPKYSTTEQVVGGIARKSCASTDPSICAAPAGFHLRGAMGRAALRNIFIFQ